MKYSRFFYAKKWNKNSKKISYNKIISKMMGGVRLGKFKRKS
nr:MAG TPA: hypothetical protein [Caudoviricetes sp.]